MSELLGTAIVILIIAGAAALSIRSLWRSHKRGGACSGNCASCGSACHANGQAADECRPGQV